MYLPICLRRSRAGVGQAVGQAAHRLYSKTCRKRRVELFAKQLDSVEGELAKRDMATVPTERLFDMLLKLGREIGVNAPISFKQKKVGNIDFDFADMAPTIEWQKLVIRLSRTF